MPSFSSKNAARFLFLLNLTALFFLKGGRYPMGLALYHALSLAAFLITPGKNFPKNKVSRFLFAVMAAWAISTAVNLPGPKGWVHGSTAAAHALNFFTAMILCDPAFVRRIFKMVLVAAALIASLIIAGEALGYLFVGAEKMAFGPVSFYLTFLPNGNLEAGFLNCGILIAASFLITSSETDKLKRKGAAALFLLFLAGYSLLLSRGAFLALFCGLAAVLSSDWKRVLRVGLYSLIIFLLLLNAFARIRYSLISKIVSRGGATSRVTVWKGAVLAWKQRPVLGWGLGGFERAYKLNRLPMESDLGRYEKTTAFAHNEYLQIAVETGLLGLLAWFAFLFALMKRGFASVRKNPLRWETTASMACLAMFLAHAAIDFNLHLPLLGFLFSIFSAVLVRDPKPEEENPAFLGKKFSFGLISALSVWLLASLYALGTLWLGQKQTARAVRLNPLSRELLENLIRLPDTDENFSAVEAALPWHQKEDRLFAYLARYYFRRGQTEDSAAAYRRAIENNPKSPFYITELADLYLAQKNVWEAAPLYWTALKLEPFYLYPRARMAEILAAGGKKKEAFEAFQDIRNIQEGNLPADSEYTRRLLNLP